MAAEDIIPVDEHGRQKADPPPALSVARIRAIHKRCLELEQDAPARAARKRQDMQQAVLELIASGEFNRPKMLRFAAAAIGKEPPLPKREAEQAAAAPAPDAAQAEPSQS